MSSAVWCLTDWHAHSFSFLGRHDRNSDRAMIRCCAHRWEHRCCLFQKGRDSDTRKRLSHPRLCVSHGVCNTRQMLCNNWDKGEFCTFHTEFLANNLKLANVETHVHHQSEHGNGVVTDGEAYSPSLPARFPQAHCHKCRQAFPHLFSCPDRPKLRLHLSWPGSQTLRCMCGVAHVLRF